MAATRGKLKKFKVTVDNKPDYCGEGAGGAQFARGESVITNEYLVRWFEEHDGYTVEEVKEE